MNKASELFDKAYDLHYTKNDLGSALEVYLEIISSFPKTPEAGYSKSQIQNMKRSKQFQERTERQKNAQEKRQKALYEEQQRQDRKRTVELGDAYLYEKFTTELSGDNFDSMVWSKALTLHYGDEDKAKYEYVKLKVEDAKTRLGLSASEIPKGNVSPNVAGSILSEPAWLPPSGFNSKPNKPAAQTHWSEKPLADQVSGGSGERSRQVDDVKARLRDPHIQDAIGSEERAKKKESISKRNKKTFLYRAAKVIVVFPFAYFGGAYVFIVLKGYPFSMFSSPLIKPVLGLFVLWPLALIYLLIKRSKSK